MRSRRRVVFFFLYVLSSLILNVRSCLAVRLTFLFQALFHALASHSFVVYKWALKLDYLGIVLCITGTNLSFVWCGMYDRGFWFGAYAGVSLVLTEIVTKSIAMSPSKAETETEEGGGVGVRTQ